MGQKSGWLGEVVFVWGHTGLGNRVDLDSEKRVRIRTREVGIRKGEFWIG